MGGIKVTFAHEGKEYVLEGLDANEVEVEFTLHCGEETYTFDSGGGMRKSLINYFLQF